MARARRASAVTVLAALALALVCAGPLAFVPGTAARRSVLAALPAALLLQQSQPSDASFFPNDRFDGTYFDRKHPCDSCLINMNAEGGFATVTGRDEEGADSWDGVAQYTDKDITINLSERGGPEKLKGKYFSKKGDKGIKWEDGTIWEKLEYKVNAAPYGMDARLKKERDIMRKMEAEKAAAEGAAAGGATG